MKRPRVPNLSRSALNKVGDILISDTATSEERKAATKTLNQWRMCHAYPINTFNATLRTRLKTVDADGLVAQRLKRLPTIIDKLKRFPNMALSRMQDIGGLRAIVSSVMKVRTLETEYKSKSRFKHELVGEKDYITEPARSGYRGVHLIYKYKNRQAPQYNDLQLELQIRTKLQHAWATAVETMGTFLGQALKSSQGDAEWREFFAVTSSAFAFKELSPPVPGWEGLDRDQTFREVAQRAQKLRVIERLRSFTLAANALTNQSEKAWFYHLIILDSTGPRPTVMAWSYARDQLERATEEYAKAEARAAAGQKIEAVLVSAGPLNQLRRAYPNFFLDTREFIGHLEGVLREAEPSSTSGSNTA